MSDEVKVRDGQVAQPTETVIPEWALHRAAQIWCEPAHGAKVMDPDFAKSIALALVEREGRYREVIEDLLWQHCAESRAADGKTVQFDSSCLSANESALAFAVEQGWITKEQVLR